MTPPAPRRATIYYGGFLHRAGGAFSHALDLAQGLRDRGWDVRIVTLDDLPRRWRYVPHAVARLVNLVRPPMGFWWKDRLTGWLYRRLLGGEGHLQVFEDIYMAWPSRTPSVTVLHAVWSDNLQGRRVGARAKARLMQRELKAIEALRARQPVVTVSRPYATFLADGHFAGRLPPLDVIELGVRQDGSVPRARRGKRLVYVGALEPRKNIRFLLEVYRAVRAVDAEYALTIVGDGPDLARMKALAAEWALPVAFLGKLPRDEARRELANHHLYVHTSTKESFSYALLEAKLAGLTTCASSGLQVPAEFIDCPVGRFEVPLWRDAILAAKPRAKAFNAATFSVERMTERTLQAAGLRP